MPFPAFPSSIRRLLRLDCALSCSARLAIPIPNSKGIDPDLAAEFDALRPIGSEMCHVYWTCSASVKEQRCPLRRPCDHRIDLEGGSSPPFGPIDSLPEVEKLVLQNSLDENPANEFIHSSQSSSGAPIIFIKKKDNYLRLAVDDRGLKCITKKDRCPLPSCLTNCAPPAPLPRWTFAALITWSAEPKGTNVTSLFARDTAPTISSSCTTVSPMHSPPLQRFMYDVFKDPLDV